MLMNCNECKQRTLFGVHEGKKKGETAYYCPYCGYTLGLLTWKQKRRIRKVFRKMSESKGWLFRVVGVIFNKISKILKFFDMGSKPDKNKNKFG